MRNRSRNLGQIVQGIQIAQQNMLTLINRILDPMGLNMSQLIVLAHFSHRPNKSQTITSIVKSVDMNQPAVTKIVSRLIREGRLSTKPDPADARKKLLKITPKGLGLVIKAYGKLSPEIDQAFVSLSDRQVDELKQGLKSMNENS